IVSVNSAKLEKTINSNLTKTLQGTVPGLEITNTSFKAGAAQTITIRGDNSLSASNAPLIILDGIPYDGSLNDINPGDIESVNVLKDASSSAIYGARSANGVIIISTKQGKEGKPKISFSSSYGVGSIANKIDMLNGDEYISMLQEYKRWRNLTTNFDPLAILQTNEIPNYQAGKTTDWIDLGYRNSMQLNNEFSISGANEKTSYYNSIGYHKENGLALGDQYTRVTLRSNIKHIPTKWLEIGSNLQFSYSDYSGTTPDRTALVYSSPYGQVKTSTGDWELYPVYPQTFLYSAFADFNATNDNHVYGGIVNVYGVLRPAKGLSYRLNLGYNLNSNYLGTYYPKNTNTGKGANGLASKTSNLNTRWTFENVLDYKTVFGSHTISFTGLFSREGNTSDQSYLTGQGFVSDATLYNFMTSASIKNISSYYTESYIESLMGRLNYDFGKKYFATFTVRRDGYSGFGANNKYGVFPSAAVGWTISEENFLKNSTSMKFVDLLKLRFSYGINGNMAIPAYRTLDSFSSVPMIFGDNSTTVNGLLNSVIGNPDLRWEGTEAYNVALDFGFFKNRLTGTVDLWKSNSKDLLMTRSVPVMNGYSSVWDNIGQVENKGIELSLNSINITKGDFMWNSSFNFSKNSDKITSLSQGETKNIANLWFVGEPLSVIYNYKQTGVWQLGQEAEIAASPQKGEQPGAARLEDVNKDGKLDASDKVILGSRTPSWRAGLTNEFKYKRWSFDIFINTVQGIKQDNGLLFPIKYGIDKNANFLNIPYWRPDRPNNRFTSVGYMNPWNIPYLDDASFVRIKDATLSYDLSSIGIIKSWGINKLTLSVTCRNLYTFTKWIGWDPETTVSGSEALGAYPSAREISFGVKIDL
ncbi:MAG: SusC/RagA family TonB-linked outer membrane protein, partial [Bacteroidales bacterium]